jgi:hypothetical protein
VIHGFIATDDSLTRPGHVLRWLLLGAVSLLVITIAGCAPAPATPPAQATLAAIEPIQTRLAEWEILLTPSAIPAGTVRFAVTNFGSMPHAFEIEGQNVQKEARELGPGQTTNMLAELRPGNYVAFCSIGDHRERGMRAPLVVT